MKIFNTARGFVERGIGNFEFIVSERIQVNRAMSALTFLLFKLNTLHKHCTETTIIESAEAMV